MGSLDILLSNLTYMEFRSNMISIYFGIYRQAACNLSIYVSLFSEFSICWISTKLCGYSIIVVKFITLLAVIFIFAVYKHQQRINSYLFYQECMAMRFWKNGKTHHFDATLLMTGYQGNANNSFKIWILLNFYILYNIFWMSIDEVM